MNIDDSILNNNIKRLPEAFFNNIEEMSQRDVAFVVANTLFDSISPEVLRDIVDMWIVSDSTFRPVGNMMYAYEYLGGPTMSIYDLHARFLALMLKNPEEMSSVVSCSRADSSSAICQAFRSASGCSPYILQAVGVLSELEKRQLVSIVPSDKLCVIKCDESTLEILSQRAVNHMPNQSTDMLITDDNLYYRVSRVAILFDMYRRLKVLNPDKKLVFACNKSQKSCMDACMTAVKMGLPIKIIDTISEYDRDEAIKRAYKLTGYILSPRAVEQWVSLDKSQFYPDEIGVFVQPSHPAKHRKLLEPLINQVIPLPHKLYFNPSIHLRYRFNAPTVNTIINFLTN